MSNDLGSNKVVVEAPMSFTGATKRIWKLTDNDKIITIPLAVVLLIIAYVVILCWYVVFGVFLLPYRMIRRSQRNNKRESLRHEEALEAIEKTKS